MSDRNQSKFKVIVVDPNLDPSVAECTATEQAKNKDVTGVRALGRWGLIETANGTYCLDNEGVGDNNPIDKKGQTFAFRHDLKGGAFECIPFAQANYSLAECKACTTGEVLSLDEFIGCGSRKDANFTKWEAFLEEQNIKTERITP